MAELEDLRLVGLADLLQHPPHNAGARHGVGKNTSSSLIGSFSALQPDTICPASVLICDEKATPAFPSQPGTLMRIETDVKLDFKDVLIRPKRSTLNTRSAVDVNRMFRFIHTGSEWKGFPLIAANMDVTGTMAMARALGKHGALTALHKHYPEDELARFFAGPDGAHAFYSLGTTAADLKKLAAVAKAARIRLICLDVANGYAKKFLDVVKRVRDEHPEAVIMAGNVVTGDMTEALVIAGADIVKIGIGPGSVCTTRRVTGVGYPQLSAIIECADAAHGLKGWVCADGGAPCPATSPRPTAPAPISSCSAACSPATTNAPATSATKCTTAKRSRSACPSTACRRRRR